MAPEPDPFEQFQEELASWEMIEAHGPTLAKEAREVLAAHPDAEPVGLIIAPDAKEAVALLGAFERATGRTLAGRGVVGILPRAMIEGSLSINAPHLLENFVRMTGDRARLTVVAITRHGAQVAGVPLERELG